ncbi:MAG: MBL fold metallo-hydrolase [Parahaliea sp.]
MTVQDRHCAAQGLTTRLSDGDVLKLGSIGLHWIHTPGHTPESSCVYVPEQAMVFTGDTLLIRGTGRTDFQSGCARNAYRNLISKLMTVNRSFLCTMPAAYGAYHVMSMLQISGERILRKSFKNK